MSRDGSFGGTKNKKGGTRTVLTRAERIQIMVKRGTWGTRESALHLPKTRV